MWIRLTVLVLLSISITVQASVSGTDKDKGPFFQALAESSLEAAAYTLVLDQYLEIRCGKKQSVNKLISVTSNSYINVFQALKEGKYIKAKMVLSNIEC